MTRRKQEGSVEVGILLAVAVASPQILKYVWEVTTAKLAKRKARRLESKQETVLPAQVSRNATISDQTLTQLQQRLPLTGSLLYHARLADMLDLPEDFWDFTDSDYASVDDLLRQGFFIQNPPMDWIVGYIEDILVVVQVDDDLQESISIWGRNIEDTLDDLEDLFEPEEYGSFLVSWEVYRPSWLSELTADSTRDDNQPEANAPTDIIVLLTLREHIQALYHRTVTGIADIEEEEWRDLQAFLDENDLSTPCLFARDWKRYIAKKEDNYCLLRYHPDPNRETIILSAFFHTKIGSKFSSDFIKCIRSVRTGWSW